MDRRPVWSGDYRESTKRCIFGDPQPHVEGWGCGSMRPCQITLATSTCSSLLLLAASRQWRRWLADTGQLHITTRSTARRTADSTLAEIHSDAVDLGALRRHLHGAATHVTPYKRSVPASRYKHMRMRERKLG